MDTVPNTMAVTKEKSQASASSGQSLWGRALQRLRRDPLAIAAFAVVCLYGLVAILAAFGVVGAHWDELITDGREGVSAAHWFGTNLNGQDILRRALYSTKTAFEVGLVVAAAATIIGAIFGAIGGFYQNSWLDEFLSWLCGCLDAIPFYLFVAAVAFALKDNPYAMHIAMIVTFWTGTMRLVRAEVIKLSHLEFVQAARALGVNDMVIIARHVLPNTMHILIVQATITFVEAIKAEAVLSFLGLGVKESVSWGVMLSEASTEVSAGILNNFWAASAFLFFLVIAFNVFADALQDALDPKATGGRT